MTRSAILFPFALSVALLSGAPAFAQGDLALGERPIKRAEVTTFVKKQFAEMDANHDGQVSQAEFQAYRAKQPENGARGIGHIGGRWFEKTDADGNGRVSLEEAIARPLQMFDMADMNHDGVASIDEQSVAQLLMGK
ncbi:MAG TPA: EF-hand domain-containing protein [Sphingobium sp.]